MLTIDTVLKNAVLQLKGVTPTANLDAELILCHVLDCDRIKLISNKYEEMSPFVQEQFGELIKRRIKGEPVQYIVGFQEFMGLPFKVEKGVLIPRPDTETLVEKVLELANGKETLRILDIGTGSGAIPIALAHYLKNAKLWTVDISEKASVIAESNAHLNSVDGQITFLLGDLFEPLETLKESLEFDIIVSNPPYIPTRDIDGLQVEVAQFEPRLALDGGMDGLKFYRTITKEAVKYLTKDGIIVFEIGYNQAKAVSELLVEAKFKSVEVIKDLAGNDRVIIGRI